MSCPPERFFVFCPYHDARGFVNKKTGFGIYKEGRFVIAQDGPIDVRRN